VSARSGSPIRLSAALVLLGYVGSCGVSSAAPATVHPETQTAARAHADLTRNREALRKLLTAQARGTRAEHSSVAGHGAHADTAARAAHGIPGHARAAPTSDASLRAARGTPRQGPEGALALGNGAGQPNTAAASVSSGGPALNSRTALNRPRIAPAAGALGGALASNTLTPVHHSPAAPVTLGGAPVGRNARYSAIDGGVFHHKP
jgi:hypothetical protein